jgi:acetyl-CoA carboxylase carboxyl transferase subunit beta
MVDMVVHRHNLRPTIGSLLGILTHSPAIEAPANLLIASDEDVTMRDVVVAAEGDEDLATPPPEAAHAE